MRKSRFTEEQMVVAIRREADRATVAEAAQKHKVSEPTIYAWRRRKRICLHEAARAHAVQGQHGLGLDFVFDTTATGQQLKCPNVIDEYTRECLAIDVAGSIRSKRVIEVLSRLVSTHGAPLFMRSENGPEFVSRAVLEWIASAGIATVLNDPGKPWQNGADESFNGRFRNECLSVEWFHRAAKPRWSSSPGVSTTTRSGRTAACDT